MMPFTSTQTEPMSANDQRTACIIVTADNSLLLVQF